jgi:hypothetical protein
VSGYLVNLARRSAGMVPVANPRVGPGGGPDARLVRGLALSAAPPTLDGATPPIRAAGRVVDEAPRNGPASRLATDDVTSRNRNLEPRELEEPRPLRRNAAAPGVEPRDDAGSASLRTRPTVGDSTVPAVIGPALMDRTPEAQRDVKPRRRDREASGGAPDGPPRSQAPRATVVEPALSPGLLAGKWTVIEPRGRGREVDVRIGTIEIHTEPGGAASPAHPPITAAPTAGRPHGGFDDFVRLRTYAPWER